MNLYAVIGVLVAVFRAHAFCQRGQGVGQTAVFLGFLTLLGAEFALFGDILIDFVDVDIAGGLVEQGARGVELGLHCGEHLEDCGEVDDGFAELTAVFGICQSLAIGEFADADALGGDAEAGAVHQGHHIFDKAHAA